MRGCRREPGDGHRSHTATGGCGERIGSAVDVRFFHDALATSHYARRGGLERQRSGWGCSARSFRIWRRFGGGSTKGIWEIRSASRHFLHSKAMAWAAFDRAIRSAEQFHLEARLERWRAIRSKFTRSCRRGFNAKISYYAHCYGGKTMDASLLLIPLVGFLPAR